MCVCVCVCVFVHVCVLRCKLFGTSLQQFTGVCIPAFYRINRSLMHVSSCTVTSLEQQVCRTHKQTRLLLRRIPCCCCWCNIHVHTHAHTHKHATFRFASMHVLLSIFGTCLFLSSTQQLERAHQPAAYHTLFFLKLSCGGDLEKN